MVQCYIDGVNSESYLTTALSTIVNLIVSLIYLYIMFGVQKKKQDCQKRWNPQSTFFLLFQFSIDPLRYGKLMSILSIYFRGRPLVEVYIEELFDYSTVGTKKYFCASVVIAFSQNGTNVDFSCFFFSQKESIHNTHDKSIQSFQPSVMVFNFL